jgi:hypothetical protein
MSLASEIRKERKEHPWASARIARRIVLDHLRKKTKKRRRK